MLLNAHNAPGNFGTAAPFPSLPDGFGNFVVTNNVQLLSARVNEARSWVVTLMPVTTTIAKTQSPWEASKFDGIVGAVLAGTPTVPVNEFAGGFKVKMRWGAGGIAGEAIFDYPMAGCSFGVTADTLDLSVIVLNTPTTTYPDAGSVPMFGAHMSPGHSAAGVRLTDVAQNVTATDVQEVGWTVKPYSRYLHVSQLSPTNAAKRYSVQFFNTNPVAPLTATFDATDDGSQNTSERPIMVPPQANYVQLMAAEPGEVQWAWVLTWEMYFQ